VKIIEAIAALNRRLHADQFSGDAPILTRLEDALTDLISDDWWAKQALDHWTESAPTIAQIIRKRIEEQEQQPERAPGIQGASSNNYGSK